MSDWKILLLHTKRTTLLKRAFEAAFPGQVISLFVPALRQWKYADTVHPSDLMEYFRRRVFDTGIWNGRVLTIYGDGDWHHYTYALARRAAERLGLQEKESSWTYFHFDQHRDDWMPEYGEDGLLSCARFVDFIARDHNAVPFMVGPEAYPYKDSKGYLFQAEKKEVPIFSNSFSSFVRRSRPSWQRVRTLHSALGRTELPSHVDLQNTPAPAYLSFDLDCLAQTEIVTNFDQNESMTLRRLCQTLDRIRPYKRIFSADMLGFPDDCTHPLSTLTMVILARKILGRGIENLLHFHTEVKRKQALMYARAVDGKGAPFSFHDRQRLSPISEGELLEVLHELE